MPTVELQPPLVYSWWVLWMGISVLAIAIIWAGWLVIRARMGRAPTDAFKEPTLADITEEMRTRYLGHIDQISADFAQGKLDTRGVHLALAAVLRALATERLGADMEVATCADIFEKARIWPAFVQLVHRCEEASFGVTTSTEAQVTLAQSRQVVG